MSLERTAPILAAVAAVAAIVAAAMLAAAVAAPPAAAARLVDVSRKANVYERNRHTWSAEAGDYNGDGWQDLIVINHYEPEPGNVHLYVNRRDVTFADVDTGPDTFNKRDRHNCAFGDANLDGRVDIYCTIGGGRGSGRNANELWLQQPNGDLVNRAPEYGVVDLNGRGRDTTFIDVDNDGDDDLFVGNKFPRTDSRKSKNKLYINLDGERFRNAREYGVNRQVGGKIVQRVDYNLDGFDDIFLCGERHAFLYRNVRGNRFENVSRPANVDFPCESALMARLDSGARPDVAIASKTRLKVLHARRNGTFRLVYKRNLTGGTEIASGRVNGDARADIYVVQRGRPDADQPDLMLINTRGGRRFRNVGIPQTRLGKGDFVTSLDYDRNGRTDFFVQNGYHKHAGPNRLLATRR